VVVDGSSILETDFIHLGMEVAIPLHLVVTSSTAIMSSTSSALSSATAFLFSPGDLVDSTCRPSFYELR